MQHKLPKLTKAQRAKVEPLIEKAALACLRYEAAGEALDPTKDATWRENEAAENAVDRAAKRLRRALAKVTNPASRRRS